jgi:hypothetical protein
MQYLTLKEPSKAQKQGVFRRQSTLTTISISQHYEPRTGTTTYPKVNRTRPTIRNLFLYQFIYHSIKLGTPNKSTGIGRILY